MIGKPIKGRGFRGLLEYLAGRAGAELIGGNMEGTNPRELARELGFSRALRPTLGKAVCHIPLRLPYGEHLSREQWRRIAERVTAWMGFADSSYALYLHPQNPEGEHLHIVASRVTHLGTVVDDSNDMERLMQIERRIERDYGLREVPHRKALRRPLRGEHQLEARTGEGSERRRLQEVVGEAARAGRTVSEFLAELEGRGVEVRASVTSTGRVTGIRYRLGGYTFAGSGLGTELTWPGLLQRRQVVYDEARDLPALVAAAGRFEARTAMTGEPRAGPGRRDPSRGRAGPAASESDDTMPGPSSRFRPPHPAAHAADSNASADAAFGGRSTETTMPADSPASRSPYDSPTSSEINAAELSVAEAAAAEAPAVSVPAAAAGREAASGAGAGIRGVPARPDTAEQVSRQLAALGAKRFDLLAVEAATGEHRHRRGPWTPEQVQAALPWLKHLNAQGCEILVRSSAPAGLSHFEGVHAGAVEEGRTAGLEPAAVLRTPDGAREVWMRGGAELPPPVQELVDAELGRRLRPGRAPQAAGYGHLAGFTSPFAQRAGGLERAPFLTLEEAGGRVYGGFRGIATECRAAEARRVLEQRAEREIAALGRPEVEKAARGLESAGRPESASKPAAGAPRSPTAALGRLLDEIDLHAERSGLVDPALAPAAGDVERSVARWTAAREAHGEAMEAGRALASGAGDRPVGAEAARIEAAILATFREQEEARRGVADRIGVREPPEDLAIEAARNLARWRGVLALAEEHLDQMLGQAGAPVHERHEAAIAVRTVREELADAARGHGLEVDARLFGRGGLDGAALEGEALRGEALDGAGSVAEEAGVAPDERAGGPADAEMPDQLLFFGYDKAAALAPRDIREDWEHLVEAEMKLEEREAGLRWQLLHLERAHERAALALDALEPRLEREATPERLVAYDSLVNSLLAIEEQKAPLAERLARLADHRLGRDLERLERILAREPTEALVARYSGVLEERLRVAPRLVGDGARSEEVAAARGLGKGAGAPAAGVTGATTAKAARERRERAVEDLLRRPSAGAVEAVREGHAGWRRQVEAERRLQAARELRGARKELRRAGDQLLDTASGRPGEAPPPLRVGRWRRALGRYQAAETAMAGRLDAAESAADGARGELGAILRRLGRGDWTPETLGRLQLAIAGRLRALGRAEGMAGAGAAGVGAAAAVTAAATTAGGAVKGEPEAVASLLDAVAEYKSGRAALQGALGAGARRQRRGAGGGREEAAVLEGLREAVSRYQGAAAEVERYTQAAGRTAESRTLPPRYFLDHRAFEGQPHRAVGAWSAHAASKGVEPGRLPEALARSRGARTGSPRVLSSRYGLFVGAVLARVGFALFQHYAHEP